MLAQVVQRQFAPVLSMLTEAINLCPDDAFNADTIGVREHVYHALVGLDVWLHPDPNTYPFDRIIDDDAAQLKGPASAQITKDFLLHYAAKIEAKVAAACSPSNDLLAVHTIRGTSFTGLDLCLSQLRHPMYHIGAINQILRANGSPTVEWHGYGE